MKARSLLALFATLPLLAIAASTPARAFVTLSGKVTDSNGIGIFGVQIGFVDACTGVNVAAVGNVTSSTGTFSTTVNNAGTYDVEFTPPAGSLFIAHRIRNLVLTSNKSLPTIALPYGVVVSGTVTDGVGNRLASVFVHFHPPGSSDRVFTVRDKTDATGNYSVVVAPGTYDVKYGPPTGTRFVAATRPAVSIPGNTTLQTVALTTGVLIGGTVYGSAGPGHPVINVNLDAADAVSAEKLFLSHDRTDSAGVFSLAVPPGSYILTYKPQHCTSLLVQESAPVTVSADLTLPPVTLAAGILVQGTVTDSQSIPVADVDTDWFGGAGQVLTRDDNSDASGAYSAVVPPDTYTIHYSPPVGVRLAGVVQSSVSITSAVTLPVVQLPDAFFVTGRVTNVAGAPVVNGDLDFYPSGTFSRIFTPHDGTDASGHFAVAVVNNRYDIRFQPPAGSTLATKRLTGITVNGSDVDVGTIVLPQGYAVSGHVSDENGNPVADADLDVFEVYTNRKADTPGDNTDALGNYSIVVPAGLYNVEFVPPVGVPLETGRISSVSVIAPTPGLNAVLRAAALVFGDVVGPASQPVDAVDLDLFVSATGAPQTASRDDTALDGTFAVFVPPDVYDIVFTPPTLSGLAPLRLSGVPIAGDVDLGTIALTSALAPAVSSISPASGPESGGTGVTILGSNFQLGLAATLGGMNLLNLNVIDAGRIDAVTPGRPVGPAGELVDLQVTNHGAAPATLPGAFTYTPAAAPVEITLSQSAPSIVLSWTPTGQAFYTVYRSTSPAVFGQAQVLAITLSTTFTDVGADADGLDYFYLVE